MTQQQQQASGKRQGANGINRHNLQFENGSWPLHAGRGRFCTAVWRYTLLSLALSLDIVDGFCSLDVKCDDYAQYSLERDSHASAQAMHQVQAYIHRKSHN
eukprot:CAMPEP_0172709586 /NCGR_PEP_ID=MMETSP1074-20121228/55153_1 /TAXON_ID=2916 /ORGANISM="Ceratium fusus, Strain PA161109" /LENGTH=100 /DNA_ID=CAMNT_0013532867 /DNA_START=172 /DNA_END=474 /DNA_ORIENTATION=-